jgi:hypothetical protein
VSGFAFTRHICKFKDARQGGFPLPPYPTALTLHSPELESPPMSDDLYPSGPWIGLA